MLDSFYCLSPCVMGNRYIATVALLTIKLIFANSCDDENLGRPKSPRLTENRERQCKPGKFMLDSFYCLSPCVEEIAI